MAPPKKRRGDTETKTIVFPQDKIRDTHVREEQPSRDTVYDPEDLEVPTFLRKRMQQRRVS